jgi:hypothetical protein
LGKKNAKSIHIHVDAIVSFFTFIDKASASSKANGKHQEKKKTIENRTLLQPQSEFFKSSPIPTRRNNLRMPDPATRVGSTHTPLVTPTAQCVHQENL